MAIKKSDSCCDCHDQTVLVKKKHRYERCEDCRRAHTIRLWRIRKVARSLKEQVGQLIAYNTGEGWRAGYLVNMGPTHAAVQPIGPRGMEAPDVKRVSLADIKPEETQSTKYPRVEDYMATTTTKRPVVLVAQPLSETTMAVLAPAVVQRPINTVVELPSKQGQRKSRHAPIDEAEVIRLHQSGMKMSAIVEAVRGTRAAGGCGNNVRAILEKAGLYTRPVKE